MGGAEKGYSVTKLCNYLATSLLHNNSLSVAPNNCTNYINNVLKADSGASKNFIRKEDKMLLNNVHPLINGPKAKLPDNTRIHSTSSGTFFQKNYPWMQRVH